MKNDINTIILILTLLTASYFDIKFKKIPNKLTFPVILWGLCFTTITNGFKGFQFSILGFLFGIGIFILPFALNLMGGGDVKLMGAIGALMGWKFSVSAVLYSSLAGGIIVIIIYIFNKKLLYILLSMLSIILIPFLNFLYRKTNNGTILKARNNLTIRKIDKKKEYIPYGVAISIGTLLVLSGIVPRVL